MKKEDLKKVFIVALGVMLVMAVVSAIEILINAIGSLIINSKEEAIWDNIFSYENDYFLKIGISNFIFAVILLTFLIIFILSLFKEKKGFKTASFILILAVIVFGVTAIIFSSAYRYKYDPHIVGYPESDRINFSNLSNSIGIVQMIIIALVLALGMLLIKRFIFKNDNKQEE